MLNWATLEKFGDFLCEMFSPPGKSKRNFENKNESGQFFQCLMCHFDATKFRKIKMIDCNLTFK